MKKYFPYINYIVAAAGALGAVLRFWLLSAGCDEKGLCPADHPGWIGYLILTAAVLVLVYLMTRNVEEDPTWLRNFPQPTQRDSDVSWHLSFAKSCFRAAGYALAAIGILFYGLTFHYGESTFQSILYWGAFVCGATLLLTAAQSFTGKVPVSLAYPVICAYLALLLFTLGKDFSDEPEMLRFLPQLFALAASALAAYQLWGFAVGCGNRKKSLFWSLTAAYLCLAAAPGNHPMFATLGAWHLLSHPVLLLPPAETIVTEEMIETEETIVTDETEEETL
ncbi:MAG: hypothetical protein J6V34_04805 [Oscillospiraceae bacterium]|nr:hypothetical protein [Oscillospiraceae bacterium]